MLKQMEKNYDHAKVEEGKFDFWKENGYFKGSGDINDPRPSFSMIIPPPNVTGVLHIGHALDSTLHDILARYKRLSGYDVEFVPGTDHAGIATQARVEKNLRAEGKTRFDLGREEFVKKTYEWTRQSQNTIHAQWKALCIGMDYDREFFTMDEKTSKAVLQVFKTLYDEGLIYRGRRIINWDVSLQTALSDVEVIHEDTEGKFYYFKYRFADDPSKFVTIATTRPETMFTDACLVYNPSDSRYKGLAGKYVINPANGEKIPFVEDYYVDKSFGTGLMKCTPAHDPNDYQIALRHNLPMVSCMNPDGTMNEHAGEFKGMDRFECREALVKKIQAEGNEVKEEKIVHSVGHSERSHTIVEPMLSDQWFVKMQSLADKVLELEKTSERIRFYPARFEKVFLRWLKETKDWCISRQLWWGHRIPIYTNKKTGEVVCSVEHLSEDEWDQDPDVLDTWFSSGLSPFVLMNWPDKEDPYFKRYFPLSVMITGYDIIFFWVARMAFDSAHFTGKLPFRNVFIHGLVRDDQGRKMSKSLGNGIDPIKVIDQYGVDSLRWALATSTTPGLDMSFGTNNIEQAHVFLNKVWNASRFLMMNFSGDFVPTPVEKLKLSAVDEYVCRHLNRTVRKVTSFMDKYEIGQAGNYLYDFVYDVFCSNYIEEAKVDLNGDNPERKQTVLSVLYDVLKKVLIMLFPFAPCICEEIYQSLPAHKKSLYEESYPSVYTKTFRKAAHGETLVEMVKGTRAFRYSNKVAPSEKIKLTLCGDKKLAESFRPYLMKLGNASSLDFSEESSSSFRYYDTVGMKIETEAKKESDEEIKKRIAQLEAELERSHKILSNPNFLAKAPAAKVQLEKDKLAKYEAEYLRYTKK